MAEWDAPLPGTDVEAGDPGHPEMHNQLTAAILEVRSNVDGIPAGAKGDKGDTGATGAKGDKGDPGTAGAKGDKGDPGATTAAALTVAAIAGVTGTDAQAVLEELAARIAALEP